MFFALFGAVILGLGLQHGLTLEVREQQRAAPSDVAGGAPVGVVTERRISSAMPVGSSAPVHDSERTGVLGTVAQLSRLAGALDGQGGRGLSQKQRVDFDLALNDARRRLLAGVWDERTWGPYADFARWVQDGESGAPPARAAPAVRAFRPER